MTGRPPDTIDIGAGEIVAAVPHWSSTWLNPGRRAVLWSFLDQAILSGFGFATGVATGRLVGIAEFGKFAIVLVFVTLALVIHEAIFATPMMTLAGHRQRSGSYFLAVIVSGGIGAAVLGVLCGVLFAAYYILRGQPPSPGLAAATGLFVAVQCIQLTLRRSLFAVHKGRLAAVLDLGRYVLFVVLVGALLAAGSRIDAELVVWSLALSGAAAAVASLSVTGISRARLRARLLLAATREHWRIARWLVAVALVGFGQDQLLWILAGPVLGDASIGGLRATLYLFGPNLVLMGAMDNILPVRAAAALSAQGFLGLKNYLVRSAIPFGAANGAFILAAVLPGAMWLALLFGPAYVDFVPVLVIMGVATAFTVIRDYLFQYFRAIRNTHTIFHSYFAGFVVSIVLIYPLVKWLKVEGLAIDAAVSQFTSMAYLLVVAARHYLSNRRIAGAAGVVRV